MTLAVGVPVRGRFFRADDAAAGATPVVVVSSEMWRGDFGADDNIIGRSLTIDDRPLQTLLVGIAKSPTHPIQRYNAHMSRRNGDRARFQIKRKARLLNREKVRALRATLAARKEAAATPAKAPARADD